MSDGLIGYRVRIAHSEVGWSAVLQIPIFWEAVIEHAKLAVGGAQATCVWRHRNLELSPQPQCMIGIRCRYNSKTTALHEDVDVALTGFVKASLTHLAALNRIQTVGPPST